MCVARAFRESESRSRRGADEAHIPRVHAARSYNIATPPRSHSTLSAREISMAAKHKTPPDAISLLKADHKQVKSWFEKFEKSRSGKVKQQLATDICKALTIHAELEEEIFYPAFLAATTDKDMHHEAIIEHDGAKKLIADIETSSSADDYFDSKVHVLSEMIKHHVKEEEKPEGMFAEARQAKMDLKALGVQMFERKSELM
jgi:hemerythrin superfamily protein